MSPLAPAVDPETGCPPLLDIETLFADPVFSRPSLSPDGTRLAYLAPYQGRTNIWVRGIDADHEDAVCVTHDTRRGIRTFHWTDDPRWLVYLQDTDGNEDWHLYRVDLDNPGAASVDLTPMDPGSRVLQLDFVSGLPGSVLVTMNRRPLSFDVFRVEIGTGETTLHWENTDPRARYYFGHSGEVFYSTQGEGGWEFYAVDGATSAARLVCRLGGPELPMGPYPVAVTPDGGGLLTGSYLDSDDLQLVRIDVATGEETVVAAQPGNSLCTIGILAPDVLPTLLRRPGAGDVLAARFVGDRPRIEVVDPSFAPVYEALAALSDGVLANVTSDAAGRRWTATFVHDRQPGRAYLYDHATGESRLLFNGYPDLDPDHLAPMTGVSFPARDALPLYGFLTLPVGVEPTGLPMVLLVHGGPWAHDSWMYTAAVQLLANRGYAVLQVNFRGSTGYGKRHITSAIGEFAGAMHDDLVDAVDWAVQQGYADPTRVGIYGGSYGGYAALVGVTFTPDLFAAAVDYVGMSDLTSFMRTWPDFVKPLMTNAWYLYVGDPEDPAQEADMLARSPISRVDQIRTPLLVVQGANDARVAQAESDKIVAALRARGVPVEYLVADDEGHGFQNPENVMEMFRAIERHYAEHLGGRAQR